MGQITVFSDAERRRRLNDERTLVYIAAAFASDTVMAEVVRVADLSPSQIYRWQRDFGGGQKIGVSLRRACQSTNAIFDSFPAA